jgi:hypothetical protein
LDECAAGKRHRDDPTSLPLPWLPDLSLVPALWMDAIAMAIIAMVQAAGVSKGYPNPGGVSRTARAILSARARPTSTQARERHTTPPTLAARNCPGKIEA